MHKRIGILAVLIVMAATTAYAVMPQTINYQGNLTSSGGARVNGTVTMVFGLYSVPSAGIPLWTETQQVAVSEGLYSVQLGSVTPLTLPFDTTYYLGVTVGGDSEMTPRQKLSSVPGAFRSAVADKTAAMPVVKFLGDWNSGTTYAINDAVSFNGSYYYSLAAGNLNLQPDTHPTSWAVVTQFGVIKKDLTLATPGFTSLMSVHLSGTETAGGKIFFTVRATDGGSQIATAAGTISWLATANSITCTAAADTGLHLGTVNPGCTPGFFNPLSQPGVSIFDNVSFSSPAPIVVHEVYYRIENDSPATVRIEP